MMKPPAPVEVAVALRWDGACAPRVTAKGRGAVAEHIVQVARAHGVPLEDDREVVEILAQLDIGEQIPETLFVAVAEIIAFAYMVRGDLPDIVKNR
jgi:flagellar biosynthesis protein